MEITKPTTHVLVVQCFGHEFSNFAKMPIPQNEMVDLVERIKSSVLLFEQEDKISFNIIYNNIKKAEINADKEQLLRVFNNLIKNY